MACGWCVTFLGYKEHPTSPMVPLVRFIQYFIKHIGLQPQHGIYVIITFPYSIYIRWLSYLENLTFKVKISLFCKAFFFQLSLFSLVKGDASRVMSQIATK